MAGVVFFIAKSKFLPRPQPGKFFRWDYDYVEIGEDPVATGMVTSSRGYTLAGLDEVAATEPDEWTVGSSSSISSGTQSPVDAVDEHTSWEGETLASHSDTEAQR